MIVIKSNRIMEPFGIKLSRESEYVLMAHAESITEEVDGYDGEVDFGSILKNGEYSLKGVIEHDGVYNRQSAIDDVVAKLVQCMELTELSYEIKPNLITYARITGKPEFSTYPNFTIVNFNLRLDTFWYSSVEKTLTGNCKLINNGTFETGIIVEVVGPVTNPSLTIGDENLAYTGTIASGEKLIIDTERQTAKIGTSNAMDNYNGAFPLLHSNEEISTVAGSNVSFKWRDKWI